MTPTTQPLPRVEQSYVTATAPPPPGYYPDPGGGAFVRWWDGYAWWPTPAEQQQQTQVGPREPGLPANTPVVVSMLLAVIGGSMFAGVAYVALLGVDEAIAELGAMVGLHAGFVLAVLHRSHSHGSGDLLADTGFRITVRDAWAGLGRSLIARLVVAAIGLAAYALLGPGDSEAPQFDGVELSGLSLAVLLVSTVILAPVFEELLFRGFLQRVLVQRWGAWPGIVVTSVVFASIHVLPEATLVDNLILVSVIFGLSLVLGHTAHRKGTIGAAIWAHAFFNLLSMGFLLHG